MTRPPKKTKTHGQKSRQASLRKKATEKKAEPSHRTRRVSLSKLAEEFAKKRVTDEKQFTPLQRRMTSGGA